MWLLWFCRYHSAISSRVANQTSSNCFAVGDEIAQRADAERLADDVRMQADVHEAAAFLAFAVEPVELLLEHLEGVIDSPGPAA